MLPLTLEKMDRNTIFFCLMLDKRTKAINICKNIVTSDNICLLNMISWHSSTFSRSYSAKNRQNGWFWKYRFYLNYALIHQWYTQNSIFTHIFELFFILIHSALNLVMLTLVVLMLNYWDHQSSSPSPCNVGSILGWRGSILLILMDYYEYR